MSMTLKAPGSCLMYSRMGCGIADQESAQRVHRECQKETPARERELASFAGFAVSSLTLVKKYKNITAHSFYCKINTLLQLRDTNNYKQPRQCAHTYPSPSPPHGFGWLWTAIYFWLVSAKCFLEARTRHHVKSIKHETHKTLLPTLLSLHSPSFSLGLVVMNLQLYP